MRELAKASHTEIYVAWPAARMCALSNIFSWKLNKRGLTRVLHNVLLQVMRLVDNMLLFLAVGPPHRG